MPDWPADRVERRDLDTLIPYARNSRTHSPEQIEQLANSITAFGFAMPVLVDEQGTLIAGHGRVLAARKLKLTSVPVMVARGWSAAQIAAYRVADNKLALNAGWDADLLRTELGDLKLEGFDLSLTGFSGLELDTLFAERTVGLTDPDEVPAAPALPIAQAGDVWRLGNHRLKCGDATDARLTADMVRADLCFTSPPYLTQRTYEAGVGNWDVLMEGAFRSLPVTETAQVLVNLGLVHRDGEWSAYWDGWIAWMRARGWRRFGWYVWDQGFGLPGDWRGRLGPSHEFIFHFNRTGEQRARKSVAKQPKNIGRTRTGGVLRGADGVVRPAAPEASTRDPNKVADSVFRVNRFNGSTDHPAVFPVALAQAVIEAFSDPADIVLDPFVGAGSTIIACEMTGRACNAIEIEPKYCDLAIIRWQDFTGQPAILHGTGETFAAIGDIRDRDPEMAAAE
jgi:DNA modification methylase